MSDTLDKAAGQCLLNITWEQSKHFNIALSTSAGFWANRFGGNLIGEKKVRKLVAVLGLLFAALLFGQSLHAQTTYTLNKPFTCDATGFYPVTSWSEFTCRVNDPVNPPGFYPNFLDPNGNQAELYL